MTRILSFAIFSGVLMLTTSAFSADEDPYQWLEDVLGQKALDYVKAQNAITEKELEARPEYAQIQQTALSILNSKERIPYVGKHGAYYYNFWQDAQNVRGLLRRTTLEEYRKPNPKWETVLDIDALAKDEKENWVWAGDSILPPKNERALISFSRGGGDAKVVREFDLVKKEFVKDGFNLPEAKSNVTWRDENTIYVGTDFGPGSLTDSGYPRIAKRWARGTPLTTASTIFEGQKTDVAADAWVDLTPGFFREGVRREIAFYKSEVSLMVDGKLVKLDVPEDAEPSTFRDWIIVKLRSDWSTGGKSFKAGSLIAMKLDPFLKGERKFEALFEPQPRVSLQNVGSTLHNLILTLSNNVRSEVVILTPGETAWQTRILQLPGKGTAQPSAVDDHESDDLWLNYTDFLTPDSLFLVPAGENPKDVLKQRPTYFDATGMTVQQFEAVSTDGTHVPYFVVGKEAALKSGSAPTILYGYGGFEISMEPTYGAIMGKEWLEKGGVYALANIRGGGEFGPAWHQAAQGHNRQKAYDDFEAVAADITQRGIAPPKHLGIMGGSNGGLLVSTVAIQRPELFGAVVCQVPLTDMRRYHKLLAGASWMAEYGDPDKPEDWAALSKYAPYQNVKKDAKYPRILFTTSTRDDRVHPAHARKLYSKMKDYGHNVLYYENTEGGHGGAANNLQRAKMMALEYTFLWNELK